MAAIYSSLDFTTTLLVLVSTSLILAENPVRIGVSLQSPKEMTTLQNSDVISILDDVAKAGCWIYLWKNLRKARPEFREFQLASQIGENNQNLLIPVLLSDASLKGYEKYLTDGLSAASRSKNSFCFINVLNWPLSLRLQVPPRDSEDEFVSKVKYVSQTIATRFFTNRVLCSSFIKNQKCHGYGTQKLAAKFTIMFLEISEQGNVLFQGGNPNLQKNINKNKNKRHKQINGKINEVDRNFPQPFFSAFRPVADTHLLPFIILLTQVKVQEQTLKLGMEISGVWLVTHLNILNEDGETEFPCGRKPTGIACYGRVISRSMTLLATNQNPTTLNSELARFQTPAHRDNPVDLSKTLEHFFNSVVNDTWENYKQQKDWRSHKLAIHINIHVLGLDLDYGKIGIMLGSKGYKFITSDNVYRTKRTLQIYTTAFQKDVWTLLFLAMATTAIVIFVLSLLSRNQEHCLKITVIWKILSELWLWILRILLGQPDQEIPPGIQIHQNKIPQNKIHQNFIKKTLKRTIRLIFGVWLVMSLILVTGYRGSIKSSYTLDFPFASDPKWNSSLDFFKDGSFFVYYTQVRFDCSKENQRKTSLFNITKIRSNFNNDMPPYFTSKQLDASMIYKHTFIKCSKLCSEKNMSLSLDQSGCQEFLARLEFYNFLLLSAHENVVCREQLPKLITSKLKHPKTVLMTTTEDFPFFWNQFKKQMKLNPQLDMKFIHNKEERDEKVEQVYQFSIEFNQAKSTPDLILRPVNILLSSGIFWWWEKWEQIKFHRDRQVWRNSTEFIDESLAKFKPLSFQDSDIHLVFQVSLLFLILPATTFLVEIMQNVKLYKILLVIRTFCKETRKTVSMSPKFVIQKLEQIHGVVYRILSTGAEILVLREREKTRKKGLAHPKPALTMGT